MITALKAICQKGGVMFKKIIKKDNNHIKTEKCFLCQQKIYQNLFLNGREGIYRYYIYYSVVNVV